MKYVLLTILVLVSACGGVDKSNTTYERSDMGRSSSIERGEIVGISEVEIKGTSSGVGTLGGAGLGGVAGSMLGKGSRANTAGAIFGAIAGGLAGYAVEKGITSTNSYRFIIRKDNGSEVAIIQSNEKGFRVGDRVMIFKGRETRLDFE